jgi:uncharacterized protein with HEPN domain
MSSHDARVTLRQLADFIDESDALVADQSLESLITDPIRLRAFERVMELVGESAKRLPADFRQRYPAVPWRQIAGMRDLISHAYEDLAYEVLWDACRQDLPKLKMHIVGMLRDLG